MSENRGAASGVAIGFVTGRRRRISSAAMRLACLAVCVVLPASAFVLGCGGRGQTASTTDSAIKTTTPSPARVETPAAGRVTVDHQPPARTPEN